MGAITEGLAVEGVDDFAGGAGIQEQWAVLVSLHGDETLGGPEGGVGIGEEVCSGDSGECSDELGCQLRDSDEDIGSVL